MANEVVTELTAKNTSLNPVLDAGERSILRFASSAVDSFKGIGIAVAGAFTVATIAQWATAAANALKEFALESITAAQESEEAWAKWDATQRAAGDSIRLTNEQLDELASQLQSVTRFEDEAVVGAASLLSIYENLNSEAFERTIRLGADMAALFGGDLENSVRQLGRALDNPLNGLRILRQAGIQLDDATKDLIKTLVETGRIAEAQEILFEKLEKRFEGVAEAMGETSAGRVEKLTNRYGELKEMVGGKLLPAFEALLTATEAFATGVESGLGEGQADKVKKIADEADRLNKILLEIGQTLPHIGEGLKAAGIQGVTGFSGLAGAALGIANRMQPDAELLHPGNPNFTTEKMEEKEYNRLQEENEKVGAELEDQYNKQNAQKKREYEKEIEMRAHDQEMEWTKEEADLEAAEKKRLKEFETEWEERMKSPDAKKKEKAAKGEAPFESSFEDLIGLNKRISAAAQDSPEKKIEVAVLEGTVKTLEKLDKLQKPLEIIAEKAQIDDQRTPFEKMDPLGAIV